MPVSFTHCDSVLSVEMLLIHRVKFILYPQFKYKFSLKFCSFVTCSFSNFLVPWTHFDMTLTSVVQSILSPHSDCPSLGVLNHLCFWVSHGGSVSNVQWMNAPSWKVWSSIFSPTKQNSNIYSYQRIIVGMKRHTVLCKSTWKLLSDIWMNGVHIGNSIVSTCLKLFNCVICSEGSNLKGRRPGW